MPTQNRVGREDRADFCQDLAAQELASNREPATLVVVEHDPFLAEGFLENLVFGLDVLQLQLLLFIEPAGKDGEQHLPGLKDETHGNPARQLSASLPGEFLHG